MSARMKTWLGVGLMAAVMVALAYLFNIPGGVFLLIGLVGWLTEKPLARLAQRLGAYADRLEAEIEAEKAELEREQ